METAANRTSIPDEAPQRARSRATYASFGDNGTTATATAYGHLLQLTRYFGNKPSGFFCADLPSAPEPYFVESRMDYLQNSCQNAFRGMRLLFDGEDSEKWRAQTNPGALPKLSFLQDRWPSFITETPTFYLDIQYLISQSTVYQIYTYKLKEGMLILPKIPKLAINANLLLRNLNFNEDDEENGREGDDEHYSRYISNDGHSIAIVHEVGQESKDIYAVGLFTSVCINGQLQTLKAAEHPENYKDLDDPKGLESCREFAEQDTYYEITPDQKTKDEFSKLKTLKVTVAYKLAPATLAVTGPVFIPKNFLEAEQIIKNPFDIISFSGKEYLDFMLRRNLEHILSVCSIPTSSILEEDVLPIGCDLASYPAIALTCGDVSGHRVAATASFYAFEFLLNALRYLQKEVLTCSCLAGSSPCKEYACKLSHRIRLTCGGHLHWLNYGHTKAKGGLFGTSYWASGEAMSGWENSSEIPITNTLFNFIKAARFCQIIADKQIQTDVAKPFSEIFSYLIKQLHQKDTNNAYIFPRDNQNRPYIYFTSDHALIWWAIRSAEEIGLGSRCLVPADVERGQQGMNYSSTQIQKSMITKLATENQYAKKTMLATSRSFSENKFLLGSEDTILFHTMGVGIFGTANNVEDEPDIWRNQIDAWRNIIDYQGQREDHTAWTNPLQIALYSIMSAYNKCMDSRPAEEMYSLARSILFSSSSPNGLLPGQLDENQEPALFDNASTRDSYWHATFEVPYILWNYQIRQSVQQRVSVSKLSQISQTMEKINHQMNTMNTILGMSTSKGNVNEIPDRWLYDEPRFFNFHQDLSDKNIKQFCEKHQNMHCGTVIDEAVSKVLGYSTLKTDINQDNTNENNASRGGTCGDTNKKDETNIKDIKREEIDKYNNDNNVNGYIIDIPKKEGLYTKFSTPEPRSTTNSNGIKQYINQKRTLALAKKRFLRFHPISQDDALLCYLASSERDAISLFFDRHASYDRHFSEDTILVLNKWVTELHLPFYQITKQEPSSGIYQTIAKVVSIPFLRRIRKNKGAMWINRATMGFRFDGDILDRYWTCHFIEYNPQKLVEPKNHEDDKLPNLHSKMTRRVVGALKDNAWRQRRILELVLFDLILEEMLRSTREILKEAQRCIERSFRPESLDSLDGQVSNSIFLDPLTMIDKVDNDNFLSTITLWNELEPIFQLVRDALNENLATIKLWMEREKEHRRDELQWTLNDERDYRGAISTLQVLNRHKIDRLERYSANIASFNASFARKLEAMRNDLDQRGANDIRLFTYVTVVFLPVGFATSVFSMSGAPSGHTLHQMIVTAIIALLVTFIALVNARILDRVLGPVFRLGRRATESIVNPLMSPMYKLVVQPISRAIYAFLFQVAYYIAFYCYYQIYIQRFSPYFPKKRTQDTDAEEKEKNFKRLRELGPIRIAREDYKEIHKEIQKKKEELAQEKKDMEQQVRKEKEEEYKVEEELKFRDTEQEGFNEKVIGEVTGRLKKELDAEIEIRVGRSKEDEGNINAEGRKRLEDLYRQVLEPYIKERLINEAKDRIRREVKVEIETRVNSRIKKEAEKWVETKRKDEEEKRKNEEEEKKKNEEEERKRQVRDLKKARGGIVRRMIGKRNQNTQDGSAGEEIGDQA